MNKSIVKAREKLPKQMTSFEFMLRESGAWEIALKERTKMDKSIVKAREKLPAGFTMFLDRSRDMIRLNRNVDGKRKFMGYFGDAKEALNVAIQIVFHENKTNEDGKSIGYGNVHGSLSQTPNIVLELDTNGALVSGPVTEQSARLEFRSGGEVVGSFDSGSWSPAWTEGKQNHKPVGKAALESALKDIPASDELTLSEKSVQNIANQVGELAVGEGYWTQGGINENGEKISVPAEPIEEDSIAKDTKAVIEALFIAGIGFLSGVLIYYGFFN